MIKFSASSENISQQTFEEFFMKEKSHTAIPGTLKITLQNNQMHFT